MARNRPPRRRRRRCWLRRSLPGSRSGLGSAQHGWVHVARSRYSHCRRRRIGGRLGRLLGLLTVYARLAVPEVVAAATASPEFRIRPAGRRRPHRPGPDLPNTLLAQRTAGKPGGVIRQGWLFAADGPGHHPDSGTFHVREPAAGSAAQSGGGGAAGGADGTEAAAQTEAAAAPAGGNTGQRRTAPCGTATCGVAVPAATAAATLKSVPPVAPSWTVGALSGTIIDYLKPVRGRLCSGETSQQRPPNGSLQRTA